MPTSNEEVTSTFAEFDGDGDGYITAAEFTQAMGGRDEAVSSDDIDSIFSHADHDGDGKINFDEFNEAWNA